jgi:hypothetical protein
MLGYPLGNCAETRNTGSKNTPSASATNRAAACPAAGRGAIPPVQVATYVHDVGRPDC